MIIEGATIVEKDDTVQKFKTDWEACRRAEEDGVEFIDDIEGLEKGCYVDTKENRELCIKMLKEYPEYRVENIMTNSEYWDKYKKKFGEK